MTDSAERKAEVEKILYGLSGSSRNTQLEDECGLKFPKMGSVMMWEAFIALDMHNWTPETDYQTVENTVKNLLDWYHIRPFDKNTEVVHEVLGVNPPDIYRQELDFLKDEWKNYQTYQMPGHLKILKSKGMLK